MLNELFHRFDTRTNTHDVYKVRHTMDTFNMQPNRLMASLTPAPTCVGPGGGRVAIVQVDARRFLFMPV